MGFRPVRSEAMHGREAREAGGVPSHAVEEALPRDRAQPERHGVGVAGGSAHPGRPGEFVFFLVSFYIGEREGSFGGQEMIV